ncbi:hypothetical protein Tco_0753952, partial [Tanacetum coccineum]
VWICQILQEISQERTQERMSDQEAKEISKPKPEKSCLSLLQSIARNHSSELGSELTLLAGSELKTSELKTTEYRFLKIFILASYEQELWEDNIHFNGCQRYLLSYQSLQNAKDIGDNVMLLLEGSDINKRRSVNHNCVVGYGGAHNKVGNANSGQARQVKWTRQRLMDEDMDFFWEKLFGDLATQICSDNVFQAG